MTARNNNIQMQAVNNRSSIDDVERLSLVAKKGFSIDQTLSIIRFILVPDITNLIFLS